MGDTVEIIAIAHHLVSVYIIEFRVLRQGQRVLKIIHIFDFAKVVGLVSLTLFR